MTVIERLIVEKWEERGVKFCLKGGKPVWNLVKEKGKYIKPKRSVDCAFCGKHKVEESSGVAFFGWAILPLAFDLQGKAPEVCPKCLTRIGKKITVKEPRVVRCTRCGVSQKEKIFGVGYPGWINLPSLSTLGAGTMPVVCPNCYLALAKELGPKFVRATWTALSYAENSLLTSEKMNANQANFTAIAEGHTDAPVLSGEIQTAKGKLVKKIAADDNTYTIIDDNAKVWRAVYNDLAELTPCSEKTQPGDVLIWDEGKVKRSSFANDKRVIGVHSDTFGFCLGGDNYKSIEEAIEAGFTPVAIAGRVKVKAVGPVSVGDLMMTSNFKGTAMRGNPLEATVAKAFENLLPGEKKRIEALITIR